MFGKKRTHIAQFESIVERFQNRLFRFAYMRIGVREIAEDIVQDVFLRLLEYIRKESVIDNYESFLLRSVNNACIDYFRKSRQSVVSLDEIGHLTSEEDRNIAAEYRRMKEMLAGLPPEQAETVMLKCYDGLTFQQIAVLHDLPEATVKSRYRYAIQYLKRKTNL